MKFTILFLAAISMAWGNSAVLGKWDTRVTMPNGKELRAVLDLVSKDGKLGGTLSSEAGSVILEDVQMNGNELAFTIYAGAGAYKIKMNLENDLLKGNFSGVDGVTGAITATRAGANLAGDWKVVAKDPDGVEQHLRVSLREQAGALIGTLILPDGTSAPLRELKREGNELSFKVTVEAADYSVKMAMVDGALKGTYTGPGGMTAPVTASR